MSINNLDDLMRAIINDRDIFFYYEGGILFDRNEMSELKRLLKQKKIEEFGQKTNKHLDQIGRELQSFRLRNPRDRKEKNFARNRKDCHDLLRAIIKALIERRNILEHIFELFDDFGVLQCRLSTSFLNDLGSIVENYDRITIEQFLLYKMEKEKDKRFTKSLGRLLDYIDYLYNMSLQSDERAFFFRKLDSLRNFKEVLR